MLKKFALWFIVFGLSFLASDVFGWTEQGKAFLYINLGVSVVIILALIVILVIAGLAGGFAAEANGISFLVVLVTAGAVAITLFATWGATKLFGVDFYVAYQIMTFGQCLCTESKKKMINHLTKKDLIFSSKEVFLFFVFCEKSKNK